MKQSQLFTKTKKETPKDETAKNAKLLIRGGFIAKEMAGVYSYLPLGLLVLNKVAAIIRKEMHDVLGAQEVLLSTLQKPEPWQLSKRWDDKDVDVWFKSTLKNKSEVGLGLSHEEPLTVIMRNSITSYRDLPRYVFQIQNKFRNELRAQSGLIRAREFLMKDLYSFHANKADRDEFYKKIQNAYHRIFSAVGLGDNTYLTYASGGVFSKFSHEFQTLCETGEDTIYLAKDKSMAVNKEVYTDEVLKELGKTKADFDEVHAIEVGNIFKLGVKFSEPLELMFTDEQGKSHPVEMASYGIGLGRLVGTVVETLSDEKGIVWPASIAPFDVHVVELNPKHDAAISTEAEKLVKELEASGKEVLHDDRDLSPGQKFADSDLIGIPVRMVVSERTMKAGKPEVKNRT